MPPATLSLHAFRHATPTPAHLTAFYTALHARAAATPSLFISLAALPDLLAALRELQRADPHRALALHAVPFVVKDNIDAPPHRTTAACPRFAYAPSRPAFVVARLVAAGAICLGKVNMDQFASGLVGTRSPYGTPCNAYNPAYIPGGSSSGSAVAVATGLCVFALATDTAGSGRVPAAMNGIVGIKPTKGLLSTTGVVPAARSLDCVAIFASNIEDAAAVLNASAVQPDVHNLFTRLPPVTKSSPPTPYSFNFDISALSGGKPLCFGLPAGEELTFGGDQLSAHSFRKAVSTLQSLDMNSVDIDFSIFREAASLLYGGPFVAERYSAVGSFIKQNIEKHAEDFDEIVSTIILDAEKHKAWQLYDAEIQMRQFINRANAEVWGKVSILVLPTIPCPVTVEQVKEEPKSVNSMLGTYTNFVNLMDYCAVSVPSPVVEEEMTVPRGVTFVARAFEEEMLLKIAKDYTALL